MRSWALTNEVSYCLRFVVTSRALSSVVDIHVVQMLVKPYVPSDKLEGSSVVNSGIDKLFVECLMVCLCLFPSMVFVCQLGIDRISG